MSGRKACPSRVACRVVGDYQFAGLQYGAEQGFQIGEFQASRFLFPVKGAGLFIPGNIGQRMGFQIREAICLVKDLAHESEFALSELQNFLGHGRENFLVAHFSDHLGLNP